MKSLRAVSALHGCTLRLTSEARKLLFVDEQLQSLANVDPPFAFDTKTRELVKLNAVLVEPERLADHLGLCSVFVFAEGAD